MNDHRSLLKYIFQIADNSLILGHRLSEWCGHGPVLEQDIALTNISLDLIGQSRTLYQYAAQIEGNGKTEDDYPFMRTEREFRNILLVEHENVDFAYTIVRQFFFDCFNYFFLTELQFSSDQTLSGYAKKSLKEVRYHLRFSSEWVIRLGDGTEESNRRMQKAVDGLWEYKNECLIPSEVDIEMAKNGVGVDLSKIKTSFDKKIIEVLNEATLTPPESSSWDQKGGKEGIHTERLGFILAELQYMQRAYPGLQW